MKGDRHFPVFDKARRQVPCSVPRKLPKFYFLSLQPNSGQAWTSILKRPRRCPSPTFEYLPLYEYYAYKISSTVREWGFVFPCRRGISNFRLIIRRLAAKSGNSTPRGKSSGMHGSIIFAEIASVWCMMIHQFCIYY